ncbi:MAG: hypothetical protein LCH84_15900 [Gemmatimonadetes bacterium]|nr:hypothetical protein [Gemmatimonadota bacterium]
MDAAPSVRTLRRAAVAVVSLAALLGVGVVLPAESVHDPLGTGRLLGLAEMGRIKAALAAEAARDAAPTTVQSVTTGVWRDSMTVTLPPLAGIELKLRMRAGAKAEYTWRAAEAPVFFHMHGEPPNAPRDAAPHRYVRGTALGDSGTFTAAFDGVHGWFWRNRNDVPVSITLRTRGDYIELKEMP